jgi:hypothetical protein
MLKKLLYLYNDGHNPFPSMGRGGLGYHLPQYPKVMHGTGPKKKPIIEKVDDLIDEIIDLNSQLQELTVTTPEPIVHETIEPILPEPEPEPETEPETEPDDLESDRLKALSNKSMTKQIIQDELRSYSISFKNSDKREDLINKLYSKYKEIKQKEPINSVEQDILPIMEQVGAIPIKPISKPEPVPNPEVNIYKDITHSNVEEITENVNRMLKDGFKIYEEFTPEQKNQIIEYILNQKNGEYHKKQESFGKNAFISTSISKYTIEQSLETLGIDLPDIIPEKEEGEELKKEFEDYYDKEYRKHDWDNKGVAYEDYLLENKQDYLKDITESKDIKPFTSSATSKSFYVDEDETKGPIMVYGRPLYAMSAIDLHNKDTAIEIKYKVDLDHIEIQGAKLYGNEYRKPYYTNVNGEWKLYNIWMNEFNHGNGGWEYSKSKKKLNIFGLIDTGQYLYKFTDVFEDFPFEEDPIRKGKKGEILYTIIKSEMTSGNYLPLKTNDGKEQWYKINKNIKGMKRV